MGRHSTAGNRTHTHGRGKKVRVWIMKTHTMLALYLSFILFIAITAAILASATTANSPIANPFKAGQPQTALFKLYYPAQLPDGLSIDDSSITVTDLTIVSMRITDGTGSIGKSLTLTQQALPSSYNVDTFIESLATKTTIDTTVGTATVGTINAGDTRLANIVTKDGTWILIQASQQVSVDDLTLILKSLVRAD